MSSNYEWQKHHAHERVRARRQEAELHRLAKQANGGAPSSFRRRYRVKPSYVLIGAVLALALAAAFMIPQFVAVG
jgi:hypothetical protein